MGRCWESGQGSVRTLFLFFEAVFFGIGIGEEERCRWDISMPEPSAPFTHEHFPLVLFPPNNPPPPNKNHPLITPSHQASSTAKGTRAKWSTAPASLSATGAKNPKNAPSCSTISRPGNKDSLLSPCLRTIPFLGAPPLRPSYPWGKNPSSFL